ncbi:zinc finger protein 277 [Sitodiplosis mosellana]|uniref:zinc finger protein 277 n=1 Tax=Sitodiplosis mosellana TaxID=263140 RepID=UPI002445053C|nr:zinc finger protein 277 [Sitodiplosis mosellana]
MSEKSEGVVGPLNFAEKCGTSVREQLYPIQTLPCLFCDKIFEFYKEKQDYLTHLYLQHRLIIGDEDEVAIFHDYLAHWRNIFCGEDTRIAEFCTTMLMDILPNGTPSKNEKYFLLCDVLPQDNELRQKLRKKCLELALTQHQYERTDQDFERNCLFCRDVIKPTRSTYVEHLFSKHFMQLGKPENLVFIDELIDTVQQKLENLVCLFCEKTFKDRPTLKEHMRKKGHKRINPDNKNYDRFFLIHYQHKSHNQQQQRKKQQDKIQKGHKKIQPKKEPDQLEGDNIFERDSDSNTSWSDWEGDDQDVTCLYCTQKNSDFTELKSHMNLEHGIDFDRETENMSFYDRVKMVNFVRRKMYTLECITCNERFPNSSDLQDHLKHNNHYSLGNNKDWNLPQYFFPTYEDDAFLCHLDDANLDDENCIAVTNDSSIMVFPEEI